MPSTLTPSRHAESTTTARFGHRPALDGIRALSVVAVIIYHLGFSWMPGGYLGVDAFFVLSGYLITSLLVIENAATGHIRLGRFWTRRVRRLMPPMLLLVAIVAVYAAVAAAEDTRFSLKQDALSTLLYVANWRFIFSGQSYFDEFSAPSPLRHTWSLAIEEQFYLLWPLLVLLALALVRGRVRVLVGIAVAGTVGSVTVMAMLADDNVSRAYYGTDTRIHELLVGALLAIAMQRTRFGEPSRRPQVWNWVALGGLLAVIAAFVVVSDNSPLYYRGGSLLFSIAVVALIAGLEKGGSSGIAGKALSLAPVVWIGAVSYGLYLFHWPIIVWLDAETVGVNSLALDAVRMALLFAVVTASYYLLELPIRRGKYLGISLTPRRVLIAVPVLVALVAGMVLYGAKGAQEPAWAKGAVGEFRELGANDEKATTVAFVGDSIPKSLLPALDEVGKREGVRIIGASWSGCALSGTFQLDLDGETPFDFSSDCVSSVPGRYADLVKEYDPDVVFMYSVRERFPMRTDAGDVVQPGTAAHRQLILDGLDRSYDALSGGGAKIVISKVVHRSKRFKGTCQRPDQAERCAADDGSDGIYDNMNSMIKEFAAGHPNARVYDFGGLICRGGPPCPAEHGGVTLRWDGSHFTKKGARWLAPLLLEDVLRLAGERKG